MKQQGPHRLIQRTIRAAELIECAPCGRAVERHRLVHRLARRPSAGDQRKGIGHFRANRVNGAEVQPLRTIQQAPAELIAAAQRLFGKRAGLAGIGFVFDCSGVTRLVQLFEHALAHLRGGLVREGHRQNFFRLLHRFVRQQFEHPLNQQPGLARACRRLHDDRAAGVERGLARGSVGQRGCDPSPVRD
jgi:hypothetical protein